MTMTQSTSSLVNKIARKELIDMVPYLSARRLQSGNGDFNAKTWLNANEAAGSGEYQLTGENINRYPDFQPSNLLSAYSAYCELPQENVLATRGADEGIELLIRAFCKAYEDSILICPPTYGMYAISAENHGAQTIKVPLINNELDLEGLKAQVGKVKVVFLCSPGNPTGNLLPHEQLKAAIDLFKDSAIVVIDEAYIEFDINKTTASWVNEYSNVAVLRTLSKAFGLAGLRCGFTLANSEIITLLSKIIAPYPIPAPIADIASNALTTQLPEMKARVNEVNALRVKLIQWLSTQSWCERVFASDANFVLFQTPKKNEIFDCLSQHDILIRDQSKQLQLADCLRISIGSEAELNLVKQTITNALSR